MCNGYNPRGTIKEIEERFENFLQEKLPEKSFAPGVYFNERDKEYSFDAQISYDWSGDEQDRLYLAMVEFIFNNFSQVEGIDMKTFWSG